MIQGPSRDHTEQCRARIIQAMSSDVDLSMRVREAHEKMSRSVFDAEPSMKKVRFTESPTTFMPHRVSVPVMHGGSSSSSSPPQTTSTVEHERPDDSDERNGSKKLKVSESGSLLSGAPMNADVDLSTDDMRVECLLDRFERERIAGKSNDPWLSRIT